MVFLHWGKIQFTPIRWLTMELIINILNRMMSWSIHWKKSFTLEIKFYLRDLVGWPWKKWSREFSQTNVVLFPDTLQRNLFCFQFIWVHHISCSIRSNYCTGYKLHHRALGYPHTTKKPDRRRNSPNRARITHEEKGHAYNGRSHHFNVSTPPNPPFR